jgi:hypothetical protein
MCEQQFFFEYVLGWRGPSNQKADKGTIVHKVLEILAFIKQGIQNKENKVTDDICGEINVKKYDLDKIFTTVYDYYVEKNPQHKWVDKDRKDCYDWVQKTISFNDGMFDPRNRHIICPEQRFDIEIKREWAKYSFDTPEGKLEGNLAIKGTIDLITKIDDNFFEIIDWKTGKRLDWATGKEKTQEKLENDPQLRIYHYAVQTLFPEVEHIMVTINFINDGGPFSICFDKSDMIKTEEMLKNKFEKIKQVKRPSLNKTWMCKKLCHFGKTTFENTIIPSLEEYRENQITPVNQCMTKCEQVKHDIELKGMNEVVKEYKAPDHSFGFYKPPGE